ncbi:hypothetical protein RclHR1_00570001 [Rhizophagus clarus]|uniref:Uncharacterized protein n=1 Tax=Rhizophagus clarus TaxID=94130 RepID=A0A2Z6S106_9GLOM|nr:hypothetical protein RclHR1_00570001 [Rhizophagus clarus]
MIKVVCETKDAANKVMAKTIVVNNPTKFNIEKDLFKQHLRSLGQVKKIKFAVKNLYYEVLVTFANKDLAVRNCPENSQLKRCYDQQTAYQNIYKRYKVEAPKPKSGFKPIFLSAKDDFIPRDMNWTDDWDAEFSAKPTPPVSYAKVTQQSLKVPSNS